MSIQNKTHKKVIIVGAGISGASAAREMIKNGMDADDIIVLEKNDYIGGKLKTYTSPDDENLKTEFGAGVLVQNYPITNFMYQNQIQLEKLLPSDPKSLDVFQEIMHKFPIGLLAFAMKFTWQQIKFAKDVWTYNQAIKKMADKLPEGFELPFSEFAEKNGLKAVSNFLQFLVPGFGYGNLSDSGNYAARMFNYMGYTTMLGICAQQLYAVHGGYQQIVEKMLEDIEVETSANITKIKRKDDKVSVIYEKDGEIKKLKADTLVLANSPYYWKDLNMKLSKEEQKCVDDLIYYRYPVAICRIKGLPAKQIFISDAMKPEGFGHATFLFTRDARKNPEDGRLFSVYINLPAGENDFSLEPGSKDRETIINDLKKLPGVTDVTMEDAIVWKDYNPSVPYQDSLELEKAELKHKNNTLHLGGYRHDSFETVAGTAKPAEKLVDRWMGQAKSNKEEFKTDLSRTLKFFALHRAKPYNGNNPDVTLEREEGKVNENKSNENVMERPALR